MHGSGLARSCGRHGVGCGDRLVGMSGGTLVGAVVCDNPTGTGVCCDESLAAVHRCQGLHTSDDVKT